MADKAEKDKGAARPVEAAPAEAAPKKSGKMKMIAVAATVLLLEGGTVGLTMIMAGGPKRVVADVPTPAKAEVVEKDVEVEIIKDKLPNNLRGHLFLYDLQVVAKVDEKNKVKVTELFAERKAEISDRIRTIIASSDPKSLEEPGLETLRRQIGYQLEQDLGKSLLKELLIPKCTPFRAEF
jgi:flagellar basal body-associated protein FliL